MLAIIIIMKFIKSNIKSNHYENMQYDYKFIMNKEYLLSILTWMPFLHVKFMRAKIKFINFASLNCSCFHSYFSELCYWPKSETCIPLARSPPPNPSPVDIPPIHSLISALIVNILSLCLLSYPRPQPNHSGLLKAQICACHFLCLKTSFFSMG